MVITRARTAGPAVPTTFHIFRSYLEDQPMVGLGRRTGRSNQALINDTNTYQTTLPISKSPHLQFSQRAGNPAGYSPRTYRY